MKQILIIFGISFIFLSCSKSDFLKAKPKSNIVVPTTLPDFQALLENENALFRISPSFGELGCDDYYLPFTTWQSLGGVYEKNSYVWAPDIYNSIGNNYNWNIPYKQILITNIVLEGLDKLEDQSQVALNYTRGNALFLRAYAFHQLAQIFCDTYDSTSASSALGLPLKLDADVNNLEQRASIKQTYDQIIGDLKKAINLVPPSLDANKRNHATKPAVFALLARVYLSMRSYNMAGEYADSCLKNYSTLIDYNTIATASTYQFAINNSETLYQSSIAYNQGSGVLFGLSSPNTVVDSTLNNSYTANDLRKSIYFKIGTTNLLNVRPGYSGPITSRFSGLAVDEMFLIRAESSARSNNISSAMTDLNNLLRARWKKIGTVSTYIDQTASNTTEALNKIIPERRKELCFRGIRWSDLKRLNKEGANITLTRILNGVTYTLPPNSPLYIFPIPPDEIALSGIQQNPR